MSSSAVRQAPKVRFGHEIRRHTSGEIFRIIREQMKLTMRDVAAATNRIAEQQDNEEYAISISSLSQIENRGALPNVFRLYSLSLIYGVALTEVISWFGIPLTL